MSSASLTSFCNDFFIPNPHFLYFHGRVGLCNWNSSAVSLMKNALCLKGIFCFALWYIKIWSLFFILYLKGTETYLLIWSKMWVTSPCEIKFKFIWALVLLGFSWFLQCAINNWSLHWNEWKMTNTTNYTWKDVSDLYTIHHKLVPQTHLEKTAYISGYSLLGFLLFVFKKKKPSSKVFKSSISILAYTNPQRVKTE